MLLDLHFFRSNCCFSDDCLGDELDSAALERSFELLTGNFFDTIEEFFDFPVISLFFTTSTL